MVPRTWYKPQISVSKYMRPPKGQNMPGCLSLCGQESTSEDVNFFYAMTMWAVATGNSDLAGLGRIQTGIVCRSINAYFLMKDSNTNHPAEFVRNKVMVGKKPHVPDLKVKMLSHLGQSVEALLTIY